MVRGPVEFIHGRQLLIFAACAARASGVQRGIVITPFAEFLADETIQLAIDILIEQRKQWP